MQSSVLNKIADYFRNWDGEYENAPRLEISVPEMREIANMNVTMCKYKAENNQLKEKEIPKKPINGTHGKYCSVCNNFYDGRSWKSKYCGLCGNRIDWTEETKEENNCDNCKYCDSENTDQTYCNTYENYNKWTELE